MNDAIEFLRTSVPELFQKGVSQIKERADGGDEKAVAELLDITSAQGGVLLRAEGEGDVYLTVNDGTMASASEKPDAKINIALEAPAAVLSAAFGKASGELQSEQAPLRVAKTVSKRLEDALADHELLFHAVIEGVPDLGEVALKVGLGADEPPQEPKFTIHMAYSDLEELSQGKADMQALFMGGKLRMAGDYSAAIQLGMKMMQQMQQQGQT